MRPAIISEAAIHLILPPPSLLESSAGHQLGMRQACQPQGCRPSDDSSGILATCSLATERPPVPARAFLRGVGRNARGTAARKPDPRRPRLLNDKLNLASPHHRSEERRVGKE